MKVIKEKHRITIEIEWDKTIIRIFVIWPSVQVGLRGYSSNSKLSDFVRPEAFHVPTHVVHWKTRGNIADSYPSLIHTDVRVEAFCSGS